MALGPCPLVQGQQQGCEGGISVSVALQRRPPRHTVPPRSARSCPPPRAVALRRRRLQLTCDLALSIGQAPGRGSHLEPPRRRAGQVPQRVAMRPTARAMRFAPQPSAASAPICRTISPSTTGTRTTPGCPVAIHASLRVGRGDSFGGARGLVHVGASQLPPLPAHARPSALGPARPPGPSLRARLGPSRHAWPLHARPLHARPLRTRPHAARSARPCSARSTARPDQLLA